MILSRLLLVTQRLIYPQGRDKKTNDSTSTDSIKKEQSLRKKTTSRSSKKQKSNLKTLRNSKFETILQKWYYKDVFDIALSKTEVKVTLNNTNIARNCLILAADLIDNRATTDYQSILNYYTETFNEAYSKHISPEQFDDFLYTLTEKVWLTAVLEICDRINRDHLS